MADPRLKAEYFKITKVGDFLHMEIDLLRDYNLPAAIFTLKISAITTIKYVQSYYDESALKIVLGPEAFSWPFEGDEAQQVDARIWELLSQQEKEHKNKELVKRII